MKTNFLFSRDYRLNFFCAQYSTFFLVLFLEQIQYFDARSNNLDYFRQNELLRQALLLFKLFLFELQGTKKQEKDVKCNKTDITSYTTVWSSELDTLLMRYGVKFTPYRIKSVSNSLDQTVHLYSTASKNTVASNS